MDTQTQLHSGANPLRRRLPRRRSRRIPNLRPSHRPPLPADPQPVSVLPRDRRTAAGGPAGPSRTNSAHAPTHLRNPLGHAAADAQCPKPGTPTPGPATWLATPGPGQQTPPQTTLGPAPEPTLPSLPEPCEYNLLDLLNYRCLEANNPRAHSKIRSITWLGDGTDYPEAEAAAELFNWPSAAGPSTTA